jgi:DNA-directed RNA polymerase specialized sigma24 family protein
VAPITDAAEYRQDRTCYRPADLRGLLPALSRLRQACYSGGRQGFEGRIQGGVPAHAVREERLAMVADVERALAELRRRNPLVARVVEQSVIHGRADEAIAAPLGIRPATVATVVQEGLVAMAASLGYVGEE